MRKVYTVSDLHIWCERSQWTRHLNALHQAASEADVFVFNGDTFDFRWTHLDSIEETVEKSILWLEDFVVQHPQCQFHFILGNHDNNELFRNELGPFSAKTPNLEWDPYYVTIGSAVFLHGDVANWRMDAEDLKRYRQGWLHDEKKGRILNRVYNAAFNIRLHKAIHHIAFPWDVIFKRLHHYLEDINHTPQHGISNVYFGHTHQAVNGHEFAGACYHNCGAPMPGLAFNILRAQIA